MSDHFTAEQTRENVQTARQALAVGDLAHALFHISSALSTDPTNAEWLSVLDEVVRRADDPLVLARLDESKSDFITAAARAYVLASKGQFGEAFPLLLEVAALRPDVPFLVWGAIWMRYQGVAPSLPVELVEESIVPFILNFASRAPSPMEPGDRRRKNAEAAADMLLVLAHYHPQRPSLPFAQAVVLRRLGRFDEAIARATVAHELDPKWSTVIGVACAHRDAGHVDEAVAAYRHALELDPNEESAHLDIGDTYLAAGRHDEAISAYQAVLAKDPEHDWARPSAFYARFQKTGDPAFKAALFRLTDDSQRAWRLSCEIAPPEPYVSLLPPPGDATASALRNVMGHFTHKPEDAGGTVALKVTHPQSPSVLTAFRLWTEREKLPATVTIEIEKVPSPDPRAPKGQVDFALWTYDDRQPRPGVPPPDPRAASAIAAIARQPFHLEMWDGPATALAAQMGPAWIPQILCVMVHPPPLPPKLDPYDWVRRVQIAAALVIGRVDAGWGDGSPRHNALRSLVLGPVDWTVDAALLVMAWLARSDGAVRAGVLPLFAWLEGQTAKGAYTCFERPLAGAWLSMGGHDDATKERLVAWLARIDANGGASDEGPELERNITLEQYAEISVERDAILGKHGGSVGSALGAALGGGGSWAPEMEALLGRYGLRLADCPGGHVREWNARIQSDRRVQEAFLELSNRARLKAQGVDPNSHEGRVAGMIRSGNFDVEGAKVNARAAAQQMAEGQGGDPDPVVFPGQKLERLSHYVGLMKGMQTGDMMGALNRAGLDMGAYVQVAQAWGVKLASDPVLGAKFGEMMAK